MLRVKQYRYLLALGSNLGDRNQNCERALAMLGTRVSIVQVSRTMATPPMASDEHDTADHDEYYNLVADVATDLTVPELYRHLSYIEDRLGHDRQRRWAPRHMDIDILLAAYNDAPDAGAFQFCTPIYYHDPEGLEVPHRGLPTREFLLLLLQDLGVNAPAISNVSVR